MNARIGLVVAAGTYLLAFGWAVAGGQDVRPAPIPNRWHLGVYGKGVESDSGFRSVKVTGVVANSPATRLKLENGGVGTFTLVPGRDFIREVNGERVRTFEQLRQAVAASDEFCYLKIYDSVTKRTAVYYTRLR